MTMPKTLVKAYQIEIVDENGKTHILEKVTENKRRNIILSLAKKVFAVRLRVLENWGGSNETKVFTFELL